MKTPPDPGRWVYTATGEMPSAKVQIRHQIFPNTIWLNNPRDTVLSLVWVKEPAPFIWPERHRPSAVMLGLGQQRQRDFHVIQYASDWERELLDAARPMLGLAERLLVGSRYNEEPFILAGRWVNSRAPIWIDPPMWPAVDVRRKTVNVRDMLQDQQVGKQVDRTGDLSPKKVGSTWGRPAQRESVWRHNFLNVVELGMQIFQLEVF